MKKVLIAKDIHTVLAHNDTFLGRTDMKIYVAETNDDALAIHRAERMNLLVLQLDMPGMPSNRLCSLIRDDPSLRTVSTIMVCENQPDAIRRSEQCRANAVLLKPVHPLVLMVKAQQLLEVAARETLRMLLSASVDGHVENEQFYGRTRNISATGMLIETEKRLEEGCRLACTFYLPNVKKIHAQGKIIRVMEQAPGGEEFQYGLMFTDISPEAKQLLIEYVDMTSRRQAAAD